MHEWKSQEKLIDDLDRPDPDMDPLQYKIFLYEKNEWDNLPQLVPRFAFHFQRYIRGISAFCYQKSLEETTAHLRADVFGHLPLIEARIEKEVKDREDENLKI